MGWEYSSGEAGRGVCVRERGGWEVWGGVRGGCGVGSSVGRGSLLGGTGVVVCFLCGVGGGGELGWRLG